MHACIHTHRKSLKVHYSLLFWLLFWYTVTILVQNQLALVLWFVLLLSEVFLGSQIGFQLKVLLLLLP